MASAYRSYELRIDLNYRLLCGRRVGRQAGGVSARLVHGTPLRPSGRQPLTSNGSTNSPSSDKPNEAAKLISARAGSHLANFAAVALSAWSRSSRTAGSPGARSIGYRLWLLRLQPFEDGLQGLGLRRSQLRVEIHEPAQHRDQDRAFVIGKVEPLAAHQKPE